MEEELLCEKKAIEEDLEAIPKRIKSIAVAGIAFLLAHKPLIGLADSVLSGVIWLVIFFVAVSADTEWMNIILALVVIVVYVLLFACVPTILFCLTYPPLKGDFLSRQELMKEQERLLERYHDVMVRLDQIGSIYAEDMVETENRMRMVKTR